MIIKLDLTEDQKAIMQPLFDEVVSCNLDDEYCAIAAQIYPDGIIVKLLKNEQARALRIALGGKEGSYASSAKERMAL